MEAIVLAGGYGTRLRSVVTEIPKPMAPINNKPFLEYILNYLKDQGITRVILSVGYKYKVIEDYFSSSFKGLKIEYSVENEPLGTGGAIRKALTVINHGPIITLNGDTFFNIDLNTLLADHLSHQSDLTLALKPMTYFDRYGSVEIDNDYRVIEFKEKAHVAEGKINGGVYILNHNIFDPFNLPEKFSFEEFMQNNEKTLGIYAKVFDSYFIDIGIPEDYAQAQKDFSSLL